MVHVRIATMRCGFDVGRISNFSCGALLAVDSAMSKSRAANGASKGASSSAGAKSTAKKSGAAFGCFATGCAHVAATSDALVQHYEAVFSTNDRLHIAALATEVRR
jgi:hypothetical protein